MKKLLCAFLAMALVILPVGGSMVAYAEDAKAPVTAFASSSVTATGTSGTVTWTLYGDGELNIAPTSGDEGTLDDMTGYMRAPWYSYRESIKSVTITGTIHADSSLYGMFEKCTLLTTLDLNGLDTSSATDMSSMFANCSSLAAVDLSSLDTSSATDMSCMFYKCSALNAVDLSSLDTSSVTDMQCMFEGCSSLKELDLSLFDTSSVTDMEEMFRGCSSLTELDLSSFEISSVGYIDKMFEECSSLTTLDLSSFNMSSVECREEMFSGCSALKSIAFGKSWDWTDENGNVITSGEEGLLPEEACWSKVKSSKNGKNTYDSSIGELTSKQLAAQWTSDYAGTWVRTGTASSFLKAQKITVKKSQFTKTIHTKKLKKKNQTFKLKATTSGNGKITYKKTSGNKKIKVSKTGKVTVKKGLKKGKTYKVKVKVTAAKTSTYKKATKTVTLKIKIK